MKTFFEKIINPSENYTADDFLSEKDVKKAIGSQQPYLKICVNYLKQVENDEYEPKRMELHLIRSVILKKKRFVYEFLYAKEKIKDLFNSIDGKIEHIIIYN